MQFLFIYAIHICMVSATSMEKWVVVRKGRTKNLSRGQLSYEMRQCKQILLN